MTSLVSWLPPAAIVSLGRALLHFLWQGAAIAALASLLMHFSRRPGTRYALGVAALVLMLAAPLITFFSPDSAKSLPVFPLPVRLPPENILPWLVQAWLAGVTLLSLRFTGNILLLGQSHRRQCAQPNPRLLTICHEVQQRLGIRRAIRYLECRWLQVPAGFGCIRPVILLPIAALAGLSEEQLRAVIAHELAHIRRWDFAVNLFQIAAETLLFYHPAIWWLNRRIRAEREICCDEIAVSAYGNRIEYARALAFLAEGKNAPAVAMAANRGKLTDRILRLVRGDRFDVRSFAAGMAGSLLLLILSLAGGNALLAGGAPDAGHVPPVLARASRMADTAAIPAIDQAQAGKKIFVAGASVRKIARKTAGATAGATAGKAAGSTAGRTAGTAIARLSAPVPPISPAPPPEKDAGAAAQTGLPPDPTPVADDQPPEAIEDRSKNITMAVNEEYPAPALAILAPHTPSEWETTEASNYCDQYAQETVVQGANRPLVVDEAARQRYAFFYWHCMLRNGEMQIGEGTPHAPDYLALGNVAAGNPANAAGNWAIAFGPFPAYTGCRFTQTDNGITGICTRGKESGAVQGVVDGRQLRWVWTYLDDEKRQAEVDFIGTIGPDGVVQGQSIARQEVGMSRVIRPFTATPGAVVTRMASE